MLNWEYWIYLAIMALSTYLVRAVPFALVRKKIRNPFICSFLYYIPYAVLTAMTFPAILTATGNPVVGIVGFAAAVFAAFLGKSLTTVAITACASVYLCDWLIQLF